MRNQIAILLLLPALAGAGAVPPPIIMRSDIMLAQLRFEKAYQANPPTDADRARVHRAFDEASLLYFNARHDQAIRALNELTESLYPPASRSKYDALVDSLQFRMSPAVARRDRPTILRVRLARMYEVPIDSPVELRLIIRSDAPEHTTVLDVPMKIEPVAPPAALVTAQPKAALGRYLVELAAPDGKRHIVGRWSVVESPLDLARLNNERRLSELHPTLPPMIHSLIALRARNTLVSDRIDENNSSQFLLEPYVYWRDVQSEVEWMLMGKDPYAQRVGDYWRVFLAGQMEIPARVYAPPQVKDGKPLPLLIALAGAAGDESTFMETLGRGKIKELADKHGFIVVTPSTSWVMRNMATLDAIADAMNCAYAIDNSRVLLLGHALGATTVTEMAMRQPEKVARVALFNGGRFAGGDRLPPTLLLAGDIDPVFTPAHAQSLLKQAQAAHFPVEVRMKKDCGHTLIVNDTLGEAVEWLLQK